MNDDKTRGAVHFLDRMRQPINFNGIKLGKIVPCDIDGLGEYSLSFSDERKFCIEYHNKAWIFIEIKLRDTKFPTGQKLMHERLVDDLAKTGKHAVSIFAEHNVHDINQEIDAAQCKVRSCYFNGKWKPLKEPCTLKEKIDSFIKFVDANKGGNP